MVSECAVASMVAPPTMLSSLVSWVTRTLNLQALLLPGFHPIHLGSICDVSRMMCLYTYEYIFIRMRCGTSQLLPLRTQYPAGDPHRITLFLEFQQVPTCDLHRLVHASLISDCAMTLIPFVTTQEKALATSVLSHQND
jgi:hypothetical protein